MSEVVISTLWPALLAAVMYLGGAFGEWEMRPGDWAPRTREIIAMWWMGVTAFGCVALLVASFVMEVC